MFAIMVGPPLWWGLLCTCTLCTLGNPALGEGGARFARRTELASLARTLRAVVGMIRYTWRGGKHTDTVQL